MKDIIVPLDYSINSEKALLYACRLFPQTNQRLTLLHCLPEDSNVSKQEAMDKLKGYYDEVSKKNLGSCKVDSVNFKISFDKITDVITDLSDENSLVIMGTQGLDAGDDKPMGSYTAAVIKNCNCLVLAIPEKTAIKPIKKIAYLIDYQSDYDIPLAQLDKLSNIWNTKVILLHFSLEAGYFEEDQFNRYKSTIEKIKDYDNLSFEFKDSNNGLAEGVNEFVVKNDIDLIAILTHHYHLIENTYQKSLTRKLLFQTEIPLLVFHD